MLTVASGTKVYLAVEPVDLRRGHDGLCALVRGALALDPYAGHLFAFIGKRLDRIKILFWDRGGFVVYYKRLARGRFHLPRVTAGADRIVLDGTQLAMLLGGFDPVRTRRTEAWSPSEQRRSA
ncbi:MAG TPA: IS66 family insertion sequence element accessory protein TnpB [Burkholderiales bacterium]|nr:IS66 family insertion sequence element accessory protein TnpB [Burkholderiales bacterium]